MRFGFLLLNSAGCRVGLYIGSSSGERNGANRAVVRLVRPSHPNLRTFVTWHLVEDLSLLFPVAFLPFSRVSESIRGVSAINQDRLTAYPTLSDQPVCELEVGAQGRSVGCRAEKAS